MARNKSETGSAPTCGTTNEQTESQDGQDTPCGRLKIEPSQNGLDVSVRPSAISGEPKIGQWVMYWLGSDRNPNTMQPWPSQIMGKCLVGGWLLNVHRFGYMRGASAVKQSDVPKIGCFTLE